MFLAIPGEEQVGSRGENARIGDVDEIQLPLFFAGSGLGAASLTANSMATATAGLILKEGFAANCAPGFGRDRFSFGSIAHRADIGDDREGAGARDFRRGHPGTGHATHDDADNLLIGGHMAELAMAEVDAGNDAPSLPWQPIQLVRYRCMPSSISALL